MERLALVQGHAVSRSDLISVLILLSLPGVAVPELAVALVAAGEGVGALVDLQARRVVEHAVGLARPPVRLVVLLRAQVAGPGGGSEVILRLMVGSRVEHGAGAVAAATNLHGIIFLRDQLRVKSEEKVKPLISPAI